MLMAVGRWRPPTADLAPVSLSGLPDEAACTPKSVTETRSRHRMQSPLADLTDGAKNTVRKRIEDAWRRLDDIGFKFDLEVAFFERKFRSTCGERDLCGLRVSSERPQQ
jgi:hypothetical protein